MHQYLKKKFHFAIVFGFWIVQYSDKALGFWFFFFLAQIFITFSDFFRFGEVWKANMLDAAVAVKIMPFKEKASWLAEQEIYNLPHMKHDNILLFVGGEKHEENLWLITEFHEKGSLCDFLKGNSVTWSQLCKIAESMVRGMLNCLCYFLVWYCKVLW